MSKPCKNCNGTGHISGYNCPVCVGTGQHIDDGAMDADRVAPRDTDDDDGREWLARWDAFAIAAIPALITAAAAAQTVIRHETLAKRHETLAKQAGAVADAMMQIQPGA